MGHQMLQHRQQPGPVVRQLGIQVLDVDAGRDEVAHRNTPPAGSQRRLVGRRCGLHAGRVKQSAVRHPALQAGIHLTGALDPVRQLTGADKGF